MMKHTPIINTQNTIPATTEIGIVKKWIAILLGAMLLVSACSRIPEGLEVSIDTQDFKGDWSLDYGEAQHGSRVVVLDAGAHVISISGAELFFDLAPSGTVTPENPDTAIGGAGTLSFKTTPIHIDTVHFQGRWRLTGGATADLTGSKTVTLVAGLRFYNLSVGSRGGFGFDIAADGNVRVHNQHAGRGGLRKLRLNNTERFKPGPQ